MIIAEQPDHPSHTPNPPSMDDIVARYQSMLASIGRQYRLSAEAREDAAQSTWLALIRHYDRIRDHERLGGWLATTMRRECLRMCRHDRREVAGAELTADVADPDEPDVADTVVHAFTVRRLYEALSRLSYREQRLLMLQLNPSEPAYSEISRLLDMPIGSIGPVRGRALRKLRVLLSDIDLAA